MERDRDSSICLFSESRPDRVLSWLRSWLLPSREAERSTLRRRCDRISGHSRHTSHTSVEDYSGRSVIGPFLFKRRSIMVQLLIVAPRICVDTVSRSGSVHERIYLPAGIDDDSARPVGWYIPGRRTESSQ